MRLAILLLVLTTAACSLEMERFRAEMLHKDPRASNNLTTGNQFMAEKLICAGVSFAEIQSILKLNGERNPEKLVGIAFANARCRGVVMEKVEPCPR